MLHGREEQHHGLEGHGEPFGDRMEVTEVIVRGPRRVAPGDESRVHGQGLRVVGQPRVGHRSLLREGEHEGDDRVDDILRGEEFRVQGETVERTFGERVQQQEHLVEIGRAHV